MKNTDFMNLSLPEGSDKIDIEVLNNDFTAIESLLKQHAVIETMTLNGEGVIIGAVGPYIRVQNIDTVQVSIDIGKETFTIASGENMIIRETAENIGIITSGNVHITYFVNPKTYADKEFYSKKKIDELLSEVESTIEVDAELSETSENSVQNKIITEQFSHYYTTTETDEKITEKVSEIVVGRTYNQACFSKASTQTNLLIRDDTYIKENAVAWCFNPHITYIEKIPANTKTILGTVSPPPPREIIKKQIDIHVNDNSSVITREAIVEINLQGEVYITSPVAIREDGASGDQGRINIDTCVVEALKFDLVALTNTTTEGGE